MFPYLKTSQKRYIPDYSNVQTLNFDENYEISGLGAGIIYIGLRIQADRADQNYSIEINGNVVWEYLIFSYDGNVIPFILNGGETIKLNVINEDWVIKTIKFIPFKVVSL